MSANSSSSSNDSHLHPSMSPISSDLPYDIRCLLSRPSSFIFSTYIITCIFLVLPLCIFIIYHGLQQWRQKRSTSSATTMSHSDSFTYQMVIMQLIGLVGCVLCGCGIYREDRILLLAGYLTFCFTWLGEIFFHILTCVERYLAVIHPITYLSLRKERGIRIRNISIVCVWLICIGILILLLTEHHIIITMNVTFLTVSLTIVSFCSLSVLCVLIRPGPGDQGGDRQRVDQSKQRAFYTIMVILGVLMLRFAGNLVWAVLSVVGNSANCAIMTSAVWSNLPSVVVLPLMFLHRGGKLVCCKTNIQ